MKIVEPFCHSEERGIFASSSVAIVKLKVKNLVFQIQMRNMRRLIVPLNVKKAQQI